MRKVHVAVISLALLYVGCGSGNSNAAEEAASSVAAEQAAVVAPVPALDAAAQAKLTPDSVIASLKAGNDRFLSGTSQSRDLNQQVEQTATGQYPSAVVLSCIDSRIPTERVLDQGVGDIFNARVAGNYVNEDILGSMEFATKVAGSKLVVVMGHTSCGAVKGACDNVQLGNITSLVNAIQPSVAAVTPEGESCSSKDSELVDKIAVHNVDRTIEEIRQRSPIMAELEQQGAIKIVGAMYDVSSGKVTFM